MITPIIAAGTSATSIKTFDHYGQLVNSYKFRRFDYCEKNFEHYGLPEPPDYHLQKIKVPISLFWATNDLISSPQVSCFFFIQKFIYHIPYFK